MEFEFIHPFSATQTAEINGKPTKTINNWAFAEMVLETICDPFAEIERPDGLKNALSMAKEAIKLANPDVSIDGLLNRCKNKDVAAVKQALSLIANGVQMKVDEKFST